LKVVLIAYEYPPYTFGGMGSFSKELAEGLSKSGTNLTVIAAQASHIPAIEEFSSHLRIIRLPTSDFPPRHFWWQIRNSNLMVDLISKISPDLVHVNSGNGSLLLGTIKKRLKRPVVLTIHGDYRQILGIALKYSGFMKPYDFLTYVCSQPLHEKLLQADMQVADCAVAVATHVKKDISSRFKSNNFRTIHNGINTEPILCNSGSNGSLRRAGRRGLKDKKVRIAFAGRLYWIKGVIYALKAFAHLSAHCQTKRLELNVYGSGPLRTTVEKYARISRNERSKINYCGTLDRDLFLRELLHNDIVVVPSLYEACPMIVAEAFSLGIPVVASNMAWSQEFIQHNVNGLRTDTRSPETFAASLSELIENDELRKRISENARRDAKKYDVSNTVSSYLELYKDLLS
jgi:glycosyltransferase involved in cell wall biosynthesis